MKKRVAIRKKREKSFIKFLRIVSALLLIVLSVFIIVKIVLELNGGVELSPIVGAFYFSFFVVFVEIIVILILLFGAWLLLKDSF